MKAIDLDSHSRPRPEDHMVESEYWRLRPRTFLDGKGNLLEFFNNRVIRRFPPLIVKMRLLLLGAILSLFLCVPVWADPIKVKLAYPTRGMASLPIQVALEKGLYSRHGLDVQAVQIRSPVAIAALLNNEIQYMSAIGSALRASAKGVPIKVVLFSAKAPFFFIVSRYKSIPELRGKKIGLTGSAGSSTDVVTRLVLEHFGMQAGRDYSVVFGGDTTAVFTAFRAGIFDTISIGLPFPILAEKEGAHILARASDVVRLGSTGLAVSAAYLAERREEIKRMIRADVEAREFIRKEKAETARVIERWWGMDSMAARRAYELAADSFLSGAILTRQDIEVALEIEKKAGTVKGDIPVDRLFDASLAQEVAGESKQ